MFVIKDILKATQGRLLHGEPNSKVKGVSIDTRTIKKGDLFIAIKGENFDGHQFVEKAIAKGAKAVVVAKKIKNSRDVAVIKVKDCVEALGDIAAFHKSHFDLPVIAITGSVGKTTTKEMIASVLSKQYKVLKNIGTQNNQIGVPLTLLKLNKSHTALVVELGTSGPGEIARLTKMVVPDISVLTSIGESHLQGLKDLKGVYKEKLDIVKYMRKDGYVVFNDDDRFLQKIEQKKIPQEKISYSIKHKADISAQDIWLTNKRTLQFKTGVRKFEIKSIALHDVGNALAAISCGLLFGIEYNNININIQRNKDFGGRQTLKKLGSLWVVDDTYNANPVSLKGAVQALMAFKAKGQKLIVCADMLEMGKNSVQLHKQAGQMIAKSGVDSVYCFGVKAKHIHSAIRRACTDTCSAHYKDLRALKAALRKDLSAGDVVLVKGSRGMHMEKVVNCLETSYGAK